MKIKKKIIHTQIAPLITGMTFPLHKNILMHNIFDNAIPKIVAPPITPLIRGATCSHQFYAPEDGTIIELIGNEIVNTYKI